MTDNTPIGFDPRTGSFKQEWWLAAAAMCFIVPPAGVFLVVYMWSYEHDYEKGSKNGI